MPTAYRTTAQRRSRFVVTVERLGKQETRQIRSYTQDAARDHYVRRGYDVISIRKYTRGENFVAPADAGWRPNTLNLHMAQRELGLAWPVTIKQTGHKGGRHGAYRPLAGGVHQITVKSWLTPQQAGETIWHELAHAAQAERVARQIGALPREPAFLKAWNSIDRGVSYAHKSREIEARAQERRNDEMPLARK